MCEPRGAGQDNGFGRYFDPVPELPQMQALAERLDGPLRGATFEGYEPLGFSGLKTALPPPESVIGHPVEDITRRGKFVIFVFDEGTRILIHLSQAGRLDIEEPPKR